MPSEFVPVEIDLNRRQALRIRWSDGLEAAIPLPALRRACPCATCRAEREREQAAASTNPLRVVQGVRDVTDVVTAESAELVGSYALRIRWRDGHDTGIFEYATLRALCEEALGPEKGRSGR